jgi:CRP-like cAMP-binding protein
MRTRHVEMMAECAAVVRYDSGEVIIREGEEADRFLLIRTGMVAMEASADAHHLRMIQMLKEGDVLGWSWLFPPQTWQFTAVATTPVQAISLEAGCLRERCDLDPALGYDLMSRISRVIAMRLQATRRQMVELARPG